MAKSSKTAEKEQEPSTNDVLDSLMSEHKDDHFNDIEPSNKFVSSGSITLDQYVKARSGGVIRLVAKTPESGKTSQCFVFADNFMKTMDKAKTLYIKAEGRLSPELQQRTGLKFVTKASEWDYNTVFVLSCNTFEAMADIVLKLSKKMFESGEHLCVILDSLDGLILKNDKETKGITGDGKVAGVPKLTKLLFRHLALPITHYDILFLITGQYSADISLDPYAPKQVRLGDASGGNSIPHQCDYILQYLPRYQGDFILENPNEKPDAVTNKILGVWVTIEIKKSAADTSGVKVKIPIRKGRVGSAIWVEKEIVDMALAYDLIKRAGAWFSFDPQLIKEAKDAGIEVKEKVQGLNGVYEYVENDRDLFNWLLNKFKNNLANS